MGHGGLRMGAGAEAGALAGLEGSVFNVRYNAHLK